jgi:hypothetical protein
MITEKYFFTFAFPWVLISPNNVVVDSGDGNLFPLQEPALSAESMQYCIKAPIGWSRCPSGFAVYCVELPSLFDYKLVIHGRKVNNISTIHGRSDTLSIKTDALQIERYVHQMLVAFEKVEQYFRDILSRSVHEVRNINTDVKHAAEAIIFGIKSGGFEIQLLDRANNIKALSEILSARTDFLDYLANPILSNRKRRNFGVYQKY